MFQESRKAKIYFSVKAEDNKIFEFSHFSVVEYFGQYVQFCLFFTPVFHNFVKILKINFWKMAKLKIFVLIFSICKPNSVNLGDPFHRF